MHARFGVIVVAELFRYAFVPCNRPPPLLGAHTCTVLQLLVSPLAIKPLGPRNVTRPVICPRGDWKRPLNLPAHEVAVDASTDTLRRIPLMMV